MQSNDFNSVCVCVCVCHLVFKEVYQSDIMIYIWGPTFNIIIRKTCNGNGNGNGLNKNSFAARWLNCRTLYTVKT